jgi:DNA-directed RNA polymerase subunit RPC12/RpoP
MSSPTFEVLAQVQTPFKALCGDLASSGTQLALGGEDGAVHLVAIDGFEDASLVVAATWNLKPQASILDRFLGKTRVQRTLSYTCPACRQNVELNTLPEQPIRCPRCRRMVRIHARQLQTQGS